MFDNDYTLGEQLGAGAFGIVHKATCRRTGRTVAVKIIRRRRASEDAVRREVAVLQRVGMHRGCGALESFYESADFFFLVMEFVEGGELFEKLCAE